MSDNLDYLFEDPVMSSQQFALISIIGPLMPQKCDVWGLKIRGVAKDEEEAKKISQRLLRIDNTCDIYTVEVGKFFPLAVDPSTVGNVVYQNEELNKLVKGYIENKELADEHWAKRKNDLVIEAMKEGKQQEELSKKPEHPIAVLHRINSYKETIQKIKDDLDKFTKDLEISQEKYDNYTEEEKEIANKELASALEANRDPKIPDQGKNIEEIKQSLSSNPTPPPNQDTHSKEKEQGSSKEPSEIQETIKKISELSKEREELENFVKTISNNSPAYTRLSESITKLTSEISKLQSTLENKKSVNDFINSHYSSNPFNLG